LDGHTGGWHVRDLDGVVLAGVDRVGHVHADLLGVHVERGDHFHVPHVVRAEPDVHEPRYPAAVVRVLVVLQALDEGTSAVAHAYDGHTYRTHQGDSFSSSSLLMRCSCSCCRSVAIRSFSQRTSRSPDSSPWRCSSRVYLSTRSRVRAKAARTPSIRSSS